jgi:broad specificity phosphatase PhoE
VQLVFLRHAPTAWNAEKRYQGSTDVSLSEEGKSLPALWRAALPGDPDLLWCSPLLRARQTAELLYPGREILLHPGLREMALGRWEGRTAAEVSAEAGEQEWRGMDFKDHGGESLRDVIGRLRDWLQQLPADGLSVVVSHRMTITAAYCLATGWLAEGRPPERLRFPRVHRFEWRDGVLRVHSLNERLSL